MTALSLELRSAIIKSARQIAEISVENPELWVSTVDGYFRTRLSPRDPERIEVRILGGDRCLLWLADVSLPMLRSDAGVAFLLDQFEARYVERGPQ